MLVPKTQAWFNSSDYRVTLWQPAPPMRIALSSYAATAYGTTGGHTWSEKCYLELNQAKTHVINQNAINS